MSQTKMRHLKALETEYKQLKGFMVRIPKDVTNSVEENSNGRNSAEQNKNSRNSGKRKRSDTENARRKKKNRRLQGTKAANFCEVKDATTWTKIWQAYKTLQCIHTLMYYNTHLIRDTEPKLEAIMVCYNKFKLQPTKTNKTEPLITVLHSVFFHNEELGYIFHDIAGTLLLQGWINLVLLCPKDIEEFSKLYYGEYLLSNRIASIYIIHIQRT